MMQKYEKKMKQWLPYKYIRDCITNSNMNEKVECYKFTSLLGRCLILFSLSLKYANFTCNFLLYYSL